MITHLNLKNFVAFTDLTIDFSPRVNIIIGENGTGKTQLLKAILALCGSETRAERSGERLASKLCRLYRPLSTQVGELRREGTRGDALLHATFAQDQKIIVRFNGGSANTVKIRWSPGPVVAPATFIPTKEVLSLVHGLTADQPDLPTIERIFDDGYLDLAQQLKREGIEDLRSKVQLNPRFWKIVPRLANLIGGQYLLDQGRFVFQPGRYEEMNASTRSKDLHAQMYQDSTEWKFIRKSKKRLSSTMTAEGFRKIGVLQRLLSNGCLNPGTGGPLLWDEPESNLNPKLMKDLVLALLELARNGQQVILATHDYVLLKWFDLLLNKGDGDHVRFHVLSRDAQTGQVRRDSMDDYRAIEPNAIADTFNELTKEQVARKMGGLGK